MRHNGKLLPGIKKVEYCFAKELILDNEVAYQEGDVISPQVTFYPICIKGLGKCEVEEKIENNAEVYETKLTFYSPDLPYPSGDFLCFKITTVTNEEYLIGTNERPFAVRSWKRVFPDAVTEKQGYLVTIQYKNSFSMLEIGK